MGNAFCVVMTYLFHYLLSCFGSCIATILPLSSRGMSYLFQGILGLITLGAKGEDITVFSFVIHKSRSRI